MSEKNLEKFIRRFEICPICGEPNHVDTLKSIYYSNDPIKKDIKTQLEGEKLRKARDFQIGIACCSCYSKIFSDTKLPLICNSSFKLKLILVNSSFSRNTALIQSLAQNRFAANYKLTVGVDILTKEIEYAFNARATLSIWEIGSQQRFKFIRSTLYKGAAGALLIFDLTRESTFLELVQWLSEIRQFAGYNIPFAFIGNNADLTEDVVESVNRNETRRYIEPNGGIYAEYPSEVGIGLEETLKELTCLIVSSRTQLSN